MNEAEGTRETPRQILFVNEYISGAKSGKPFNATKAAVVAGYSENYAATYGSALLKRPDIQQRINDHLNQASMSAGEVLKRLTEIARAEIGDVLKLNATQSAVIIDPKAVIDHKKFIAEFGYDSNGNVKLKFHDTLTALQQIGRARGMFKDGVEVSGPGGGNVPVEMQVVFHEATAERPNPEPTPEEEVDLNSDFLDMEED